jgi:hypothetical protein
VAPRAGRDGRYNTRSGGRGAGPAAPARTLVVGRTTGGRHGRRGRSPPLLLSSVSLKREREYTAPASTASASSTVASPRDRIHPPPHPRGGHPHAAPQDTSSVLLFCNARSWWGGRCARRRGGPPPINSCSKETEPGAAGEWPPNPRRSEPLRRARRAGAAPLPPDLVSEPAPACSPASRAAHTRAGKAAVIYGWSLFVPRGPPSPCGGPDGVRIGSAETPPESVLSIRKGIRCRAGPRASNRSFWRAVTTDDADDLVRSLYPLFIEIEEGNKGGRGVVTVVSRHPQRRRRDGCSM